MNLDDFPLGIFEVECDGSACASPNVGWHSHPVQYRDRDPICRVRATNGVRSYPEVSE